MRLLHSRALEFREFYDSEIPPYAILSHRWGSDEATFQDFEKGIQKERKGYAKIDGCCKRALKDKFDWVWIDTCCIDKKSSAELSEAINSMYRWYRNAEVCYVYLADVWSNGSSSSRTLDLESFRKSSWFTRGWTLQELLAPDEVQFFDRSWQCVGTKESLAEDISAITGIDRHWLKRSNYFKLPQYQPCTRAPECQAHVSQGRGEPSVATKMSWASKRETSRVEDMAYCLLGLFYVNMPLLYGEGQRAFRRLQQEIMRQTNDDSIFAWADNGELFLEKSVLAPHPSYFAWSRYVHSNKKYPRPPYYMTNQGLHFPITWRCVEKQSNLRLWIPLNCGMCGPEGFKDLMLCLDEGPSGPWRKRYTSKLLEMDHKLYQIHLGPKPQFNPTLFTSEETGILEHPHCMITEIMLQVNN